MLRNTTALVLIATLAACATTPSTPTSWGKAGVSMVQYRIDSAQCIIEASGAGGGPAGADNQVDASNNNSHGTGGGGGGGGGGVDAGASGLTPGGGAITYSGMAPQSEVNQAAMEQRAREMRERRAQVNGVGACLQGRGYTQFRLTPEQAAHLSTLPEGSEERRAYLYSLGADANVLAHQAM